MPFVHPSPLSTQILSSGGYSPKMVQRWCHRWMLVAVVMVLLGAAAGASLAKEGVASKLSAALEDCRKPTVLELGVPSRPS